MAHLAKGSFWAGAFGLGALMIFAYLALNNSGGVRQLGATTARVEGATAGGVGQLVKRFQGR